MKTSNKLNVAMVHEDAPCTLRLELSENDLRIKEARKADADALSSHVPNDADAAAMASIASHWVSVADRFPDLCGGHSSGPRSQMVLVFDARRSCASIGCFVDHEEWGGGRNWIIDCDEGWATTLEDVTHWMPLPEPPKP